MTHLATISGRIIDLANITADDIDFYDIAWSLSAQPRFNGHTKRFYSIAEHSVRCMRKAKREDEKIVALLHDAHEAYLGDLVRPFQGLKCFVESSSPGQWVSPKDVYAPHCDRIDTPVAAAVNMEPAVFRAYRDTTVNVIDNRMLTTERDHLLTEPKTGWTNAGWPNFEAYSGPQYTDMGWTQAEAFSVFCGELQNLTGIDARTPRVSE